MIEAKKNIMKASRINDRGSDREGFIRMDKNERNFSFSKNFIKDVKLKINSEDLSSYPNQQKLYDKVAKIFHIKKENLLITPGSDAAIKYIFETYLKKRDEVIYLHPTYAMIDYYAKLFQCKIKKITFDKNLNLDTKKLIYSINKKTKAVILANPNQPTGTIIDKKKLKKIIYLSKKFNFLLLIDEAYIDFCKKNSVISEINRYNNIFVTRSFSKAFGLAGLRLGFIASSKNNIKELIKVKPLSDINSLSIKISLLLLNNIKEVEKNIKNINLSKEKIANFCKKNNITFINSKTNFVHLQFEDSNKVKELFSLFKKNKILARSNFEGLPASIENSLRFSLGELSTSRKIIKILKKHYKL